jgi:hypothetical protein
VTKYYRTIAARGITPEYRGKVIADEDGEFGTIVGFEHFEHITVVSYQVPPEEGGRVYEVDFDHLDEVRIFA